MNKYKCKHCEKIVERDSEKAWINGRCDSTEKMVRLIRVDDEDPFTVYKCTMHGSTLIDTLPSNVSGWIESEMDELEDGAVLTIRIKKTKMTQAKYELLPEFEG